MWVSNKQASESQSCQQKRTQYAAFAAAFAVQLEADHPADEAALWAAPPASDKFSLASSTSASVSCPSAYCSPTSTALLLFSSASRCQMRRQHATANSRAFRSVSRPRFRRKVSIA